MELIKRLHNKYVYIVLGGFLFASFFYWFGANVKIVNPVKVQIQLKSPLEWRYPVKSPIVPTPTKKPVKKAKNKIIKEVQASESTIEPIKKYLTIDANETRTAGLAYLSMYYSGDNLTAIDNLIKKESGWRVDAMNEIGAGGLPQALPYTKMGCGLSREDMECQLQWMIGYINKRYGSPLEAWNFWLTNNWY